MPKQPHPASRILYHTKKIEALLASPCLEQETEEQKIQNIAWRAKLGRYNYLLKLWERKLQDRYS